MSAPFTIAGRSAGRIGLGTAQFAFREGTAADAVEVTLAALENHVRLIDTALAYTRPGFQSYAEDVVGQALREWKGERPIVATKGGHWRDGDAFPVDGSPATLRRHCEISLQNLGVERVDLYQLHHVDPAVPLEESVLALKSLRDEGLIADVGLSNVSIAQLESARQIMPIAAVQNRFGFDRQEDRSMVRHCEHAGIAYLAYMPFGGPGAIAGPAFGPVRAAAGVAGRSPQRTALAWTLAQSPAIIALVGASRPASIIDSSLAVHDGPPKLTA